MMSDVRCLGHPRVCMYMNIIYTHATSRREITVRFFTVEAQLHVTRSDKSVYWDDAPSAT